MAAQAPGTPLKLRLTTDQSYQSDLSKIRDAIRKNGTRATLAEITLTDVDANVAVTLYVNFAFQSNSQCARSTASIYTLAFGNPHGQWHFNFSVPGIALPGPVFPGNMDGSYHSLNSDQLPDITKDNILAAVQAVFHYRGGATNNVFRQNLARLIIITSEAIRFNSVEVGVFGQIKKATDEIEKQAGFAPPNEQIHKWGGHTLGDYHYAKK